MKKSKYQKLLVHNAWAFRMDKNHKF